MVLCIIHKLVSSVKESRTVSLDGDLLEKLKTKQAGLLENSKRSISLSKVVNQMLSQVLKDELKTQNFVIPYNT